MFKIEKNMEIPANTHGGKSGVGDRLYPLHAMEVGDSFFVARNEKAPHQVESASQYHARKYGKKFTIRRSPEGVRVWRIA